MKKLAMWHAEIAFLSLLVAIGLSAIGSFFIHPVLLKNFYTAVSLGSFALSFVYMIGFIIICRTSLKMNTNIIGMIPSLRIFGAVTGLVWSSSALLGGVGQMPLASIPGVVPILLFFSLSCPSSNSVRSSYIAVMTVVVIAVFFTGLYCLKHDIWWLPIALVVVTAGIWVFMYFRMSERLVAEG